MSFPFDVDGCPKHADGIVEGFGTGLGHGKILLTGEGHLPFSLPVLGERRGREMNEGKLAISKIGG